MPFINGLELTEQAREIYPELEIVIFSGYNDFSYAREALRYGVVDYVLKPVDPQEFHKTIERVCANIETRTEEKLRQIRQEDYLRKYFFIDYLYNDSKDSYENLLRLSERMGEKKKKCTRMILVGNSNGMFETDEEHFVSSLQEQLHREMFYVNLNSHESLFLFYEQFTDYHALAQNLYNFFLKQYECECYFAVSKPISEIDNLSNEFHQLEDLLEEQFYEPEKHVFMIENHENEKRKSIPHDVELTESIAKDIQYKDIARLKQDYERLEQKYRNEKQFSEMYVKFVFSAIVKEIYEQIQEIDERHLSKNIDKLYRCKKINDVLNIVEQAIYEYELFLNSRENSSRNEVMTVKNYINYHYGDTDLGVESLSEHANLSRGYLCTLFKEETGITLNRYIREVRMEKAKEFLENSNMKISQIAREVGFTNSSYFCRSFKEYFGDSPESCRKGVVLDEDASEDTTGN